MKNISTLNIALLLQAVAWPMVLLILALVFRKSFTGFMENLAPRIGKLSFPGIISIDIAQVTNAAPSGLQTVFLNYGGPELVARPSSDGSIWIPDLLSPLRPGGYLIIDLGTGHNWLTSRLFLFAAMLSQVKKISSFVFVEASNTCRDAYIGSMFLDQIRFIMANTYPWFEHAYLDAYTQSTASRQKWVEDFGTATTYIISSFLNSIRVSTDITHNNFWDINSFQSVVQSKINNPKSVLNMLNPATVSQIREHANGYFSPYTIETLFNKILKTERLFEADLDEHPSIQRDLVDAARKFPKSELASYANCAILRAALEPFVKPLPFAFRIVGDTAEPAAGDWIRLRREVSDPVATWEHTSWLTAADVETLFTRTLMTSKILARDLLLCSTQEQTRLITASRDNLVAVTDEQRRFERLYDRHDIVERFIRSQTDTRG